MDAARSARSPDRAVFWPRSRSWFLDILDA